ncbi:MAG: sigma-70 family RNA polymerase sigma factor [Myxococcales bacterium]
MFDVLVVETPREQHPVGILTRLSLDSSDADLVGELLKNRAEAHRLAVERFGPIVRRVLRRALGHANDIDDVQQEVFWCLFRRVHSLRDPRSLRSFVMAIAVRSALRERRRRRQSARITLEPEPERISDISHRDDATASYALVRLRKLVLRLRERERRAFVLRFVECMTVSEIAAALAISEATTRRCFTRAWLLVSKNAASDPFLSDYFEVASLLPAVD